MKTACQELTLSSALSDPLIRTLMAADNVDPVKVESMLRRIAEELQPSLWPLTEGRVRADNIPDARFVELRGENHLATPGSAIGQLFGAAEPIVSSTPLPARRSASQRCAPRCRHRKSKNGLPTRWFWTVYTILLT